MRCPANVLGDGAPSSLADRCHSLPSLPPPPAAVGSLPKCRIFFRTSRERCVQRSVPLPCWFIDHPSIVVVGALIGRPAILRTKWHAARHKKDYFLRRSQYLHSKYWAGGGTPPLRSLSVDWSINWKLKRLRRFRNAEDSVPYELGWILDHQLDKLEFILPESGSK